jgi:hypothetical protein
MNTTYSGVLHGERIAWDSDAPPPEPVRVLVTILGAVSPAAERGARMASALGKLADAGGPDIRDPQAWQREERTDRALPGREE